MTGRQQYWYFTFMQKQSLLKDRYVKIYGTMKEARKIMFENFGDNWANCYTCQNFESQIQKFGLREL